MKINVRVKNSDKYLKSIERAEKLLKELKDIFAWELGGNIELEVEAGEDSQ